MDNEYGINYEEISSIKVDGQDSKITNQDARTVYISKDGETKRTGDFMLGNNNIVLENEEYISINEYEVAVSKLFDNPEVKTIKMIKTGKKIDNMEELSEHINNVKKANVIVLNKNHKIKNQDGRIASVKTSDMDSPKNVSAMFLGKNGVELADGEYTTKKDLEFEVINKEKEVIEKVDDELKIIKKEKKKITWAKIPKSLVTIAVSAGVLALIPGIMYANSVIWHHVDPNTQNILHNINNTIGTIFGAKYNSGTGLWTSLNGEIMNADAALANMAQALATHGVAITGITKIIADLKSFFKKRDNKQKEDEYDKEIELENSKLGGIRI